MILAGGCNVVGTTQEILKLIGVERSLVGGVMWILVKVIFPPVMVTPERVIF